MTHYNMKFTITLFVVIISLYSIISISAFRSKSFRSNKQISSTQVSSSNNKVIPSVIGSIAGLLLTDPTNYLVKDNIKLSYESNVIANAAETVSLFQGSYSDPNHPGCLRKITVNGNKVTITGSDDIDTKTIWTINAIEKETGKILVDFSPKGGPKDLLGVYSKDGNKIVWPDGNSWTKL